MEASPRIARRQFLRAGSALFAGAAVLPACTTAPSVHSPQNLESLRASMAGRLILPGEEGYYMANWPNNSRWAGVMPRAIAMCTSEPDVQLCIRWARDNGERFAIRCGGHSYAGFSTTTGLLINVRPMNKVTYDPVKRLAFVQAGATNQDMANALGKTNFAVPSGRCPTVGVSGLVLGGGWGFAATHSGLTCDSLVQSNVVLADTQLVSASGDSHKELFWALRGGGGGNFGVNTSFTFNLHEVGNVTLFNILWPGKNQVAMLRTLQQIQNDNALNISTRTKAYPDRAGPRPSLDQIQVTTLGLYYGTEAEARKALAPALGLVAPISTDIRTMSYWAARDALVTDDPTGMYDLRSSYVADAMPDAGLETMLRWMMEWPGGSILPENMGIFFAIGGKVRTVAQDATAYVHRNANYIFEMECAWAPVDKPEVVSAQREWLARYFNAMKPYVLPQSYVNFPNRELDNWARAYYGKNLDNLSKYKKLYDPGNIFRFEQSIPPA